jgi:hypothetical protein
MTKLPAPAKAPCKSCPYRKDVPAGVWARSEYKKLLEYDKPVWLQPPSLFMCHSEPESLCAGWVGCHDELLALRIPGRVDPKTFSYESPVELFASGREAAKHGISGIKEPDERARRTVKRLMPKVKARRTK